MEIGTSGGESYEVLRNGGEFCHPRLVLLREVTEAKDWQVVDSGTPHGCKNNALY